MKLPDFKESIVKDPEMGEAVYNRMLKTAEGHPVVIRALKEGIFADQSGALSGMQAMVYTPLRAKLVGRELLKVIPTTKPAERFSRIKGGYVLENSGKVFRTGPKPDTPFDLVANRTQSSSQEWDQNTVEDMPWDLLTYESQELINDMAQKENTDVVTLFNGITATDLAGGAEVTITDNNPTWAEIITGLQKFKDQLPNVIALNLAEFLGLFKATEFISNLYGDPLKITMEFEARHAAMPTIKFIGSSAITKTLFVNTQRAGVMLLRQDVMTQPWVDQANFKYGVSARSRYGMGIFYPDSVVRGTH